MPRTLLLSLLALSLTMHTTHAGPPDSTDIPTTPPLRELAARRGLLIGCCVRQSAIEALTEDRVTDDMALIAAQMNIITAENGMKPRWLAPAIDRHDFTAADVMFDFAESHKMKVRFHTGLWHNGLPKWLDEKKLPPQQIAEFAERHIKTVGKRYNHRMTYWDVVNEPIDTKEKDGLRDTVWKRALGDDYLETVYRWVHEAAPDVKLVLNDYGMWQGGEKSDRMLQLVKHFQANDVPVHAVGFQVHLLGGETPNRQKILANIQRFADLGVEIHITEMDVATRKYQDMSEPEKLQRQAEVYRGVLEAFMAVDQFKVFQTWGITDRHTWVRGHLKSPNDRPLPFDEQLQPKPAYHALRQVLIGK